MEGEDKIASRGKINQKRNMEGDFSYTTKMPKTIINMEPPRQEEKRKVQKHLVGR